MRTPWLKVEFGVTQPRWTHPAVAAAASDAETRDVHWLDRWFPDPEAEEMPEEAMMQDDVDQQQEPQEPAPASPRSQDILDMEASLGVKQPSKPSKPTPQVGFRAVFRRHVRAQRLA